MDAGVLLEPRTLSPVRHHQVSGGHPVPLVREPSRKPCAGNPHARFPRGSYGNPSTRRGKVDLPMRTLAALAFIAGVAAVAVGLAHTPTVADGRVIAADLL